MHFDFRYIVQVLGLEQQLSDPAFIGTVFAPTNQAFTALLQDLGLSANDALTKYRETLNTVYSLSFIAFHLLSTTSSII